MYGDLDNICMVTLAPEIPNATSVIGELCKRNIKVSIGKKKIRETFKNLEKYGYYNKYVLKQQTIIFAILLKYVLCTSVKSFLNLYIFQDIPQQIYAKQKQRLNMEHQLLLISLMPCHL